MQAPRLRRGLFGYTGRSVRLSIAIRERQLSETQERADRASEQALASARRADEAVERAQAAETRCAGLETELADVRARLDIASRSVGEAHETLAARDGLLDELRFELGASRRLFLRQVAHSRSLEAALEDLAATLWQTRADLVSARRTGTTQGSEPVLVLPDLEARGAAASNGRANPAHDRV